MLKLKLIFVVGLVMILGLNLKAQSKYIGAEKCKMCHNSATKGDQFKHWQNTKHSKAMQTLSSPAALEYGKNNGIPDPAKDPKCLSCHCTAATIDKALIETLTVEEGVTCESCHGPGSVYKAMNIMKDKELAIKSGLIMPTQNVCESCHTKVGNPFFRPFDYEKMKSIIAHPNTSKK